MNSPTTTTTTVTIDDSHHPSSYSLDFVSIRSASDSHLCHCLFISDLRGQGLSATVAALIATPHLRRLHRHHSCTLGLWLLSQVEPSEIFLKSISNEVTSVEVIYPSSLNAQLVRRRLGHIALRFYLCLISHSSGFHFGLILIGEPFSYIMKSYIMPLANLSSNSLQQCLSFPDEIAGTKPELNEPDITRTYLSNVCIAEQLHKNGLGYALLEKSKLVTYDWVTMERYALCTSGSKFTNFLTTKDDWHRW
ncbi:uncharacterized protein DS421_14g470100 [Arachis hypogaea]|nr:uncharacterized protein DS421_14g470100 [Arachis hypogaea]